MKKIAIIEDDKLFHEALKRALKKQDIRWQVLFLLHRDMRF